MPEGSLAALSHGGGEGPDQTEERGICFLIRETISFFTALNRWGLQPPCDYQGTKLHTQVS